MRISDWSSDVCSSDLYKDNIDGKTIDGIERDRLLQQHDNGAHRCKIIQLGVWNRDSPAKAGGTQPLPLQKPLRHHLLIKAVSSGGNLGKALKELLLAIDTQPRVARFRPTYLIKMEHTTLTGRPEDV